jgi:hypothetical protein
MHRACLCHVELAVRQMQCVYTSMGMDTALHGVNTYTVWCVALHTPSLCAELYQGQPPGCGAFVSVYVPQLLSTTAQALSSKAEAPAFYVHILLLQ